MTDWLDDPFFERVDVDTRAIPSWFPLKDDWDGERYDELFHDSDPILLSTFGRFHNKNPQMYELFCKFTLEAFSSGRDYYSHWAIAQRIRWYTTIETSGSDFKLSNDLIAIYARLVVYKHQKIKGFFKFKKMKKVRSKPEGIH